MKRMLFWLAMAATAMTSCSKNESIETPKNEAIGFGTYVGLSAKGANADLGALKVSGFTVNGYATTGDWLTSGAAALPKIMYQANVTYVDPAWTYSPLAYWPASGKVSFFANSTHTSVVPLAKDVAGVPTFTFTAADAAVDQIDCLAAVALDKNKQGGPVVFVFNHILSKIGFTAVLKTLPDAKTIVTVTNLTVNYAENTVESSGVYTHNTTPGGNGVIPVGSWVTTGTDYHQTTAGNVIDGAGENMNIDELTAVQLNADDKFLMIVPQIIAIDAISVEMTYTIKVDQNETLTYTKTAKIPAMTFAAQTSYLFNIEIDLNQDAISFGEPSIKDWITGTVPTTL